MNFIPVIPPLAECEGLLRSLFVGVKERRYDSSLVFKHLLIIEGFIFVDGTALARKDLDGEPDRALLLLLKALLAKFLVATPGRQCWALERLRELESSSGPAGTSVVVARPPVIVREPIRVPYTPAFLPGLAFRKNAVRRRNTVQIKGTSASLRRILFKTSVGGAMPARLREFEITQSPRTMPWDTIKKFLPGTESLRPFLAGSSSIAIGHCRALLEQYPHGREGDASPVVGIIRGGPFAALGGLGFFKMTWSGNGTEEEGWLLDAHEHPLRGLWALPAGAKILVLDDMELGGA